MPQAGLEATISLATYYNYVQAWVVALERDYGRAQSALGSFRGCQEELDAFKRLQGGGKSSPELESAFLRGRLTLIAMQKLPIDTFPALAATANLWLPVQAYYLVHAVGISVLAALGQQVPRDHRRFRASFSRAIVPLLPFPFAGLCEGGPRLQDFTFRGIATSPSSVADQSNLANPRHSQGHHFLGKSLSTTRERALAELFQTARRERVRPNRSRRNLRAEERRRLTQNLHPTSIADLLYRMRFRANYDDPDMYLAAFDDADRAASHYEALTHLTRVLTEGLTAVVRRRIGRKSMEILEARVS